MKEKNNATCSICGKPYHMCASCKDMMRIRPWQLYTDVSEHFKVYQVLHGYSTKVYDKNEARDRLKNIDLSDLDSFRDNIKDIINDILKEDEIEECETYSITANVDENNKSTDSSYGYNVFTENTNGTHVKDAIDVENKVQKVSYKKKSSKVVETE